MICSEFFELLDNYEKLTDTEKMQLEVHSAECVECQREYEFFKSIKNTVATLPHPDIPKDIIEKVNHRIDAEPVKRFDIAYHIKHNAYRYATVAACLAVGLVVGINNHKIKENLAESEPDGVISVSEVVQKPKNSDNKNKAVENEKSETNAETETEHEPPKVPVAEAVPQKQPSAKPITADKAAKPEKKPTADNTAKTVQTPAPTEKAVATPAKSPAADTMEKTAVIAESPTSVPEKKSDDTLAYTIAKEQYYMPEAEVAEVTEQPVDVSEEIKEYSLEPDKRRIAIGYYDIPEKAEKKKNSENFSNELIVSVNDVGNITAHMNKLGAMDSGKGYQMSMSNFYELLMILDEEEVSYRYSSGINGDDTIIFGIVAY